MTGIEWIRREPPLAPAVALAEGHAADQLLGRLLAKRDDDLAALRGVGAPAGELAPLLVAVRGPAPALPWVDGVRYFGEAPEAAGLFMPTARRPAGPVPLIVEALRAGAPPGPIVWLPEGRVVPLEAARPLDRDVLRRLRGR